MANVKVAVRVRPLCKREEDAKATIVVNEYQENVLGVSNPKIEGIEGGSDHRDRIKHFSFDYCYFSLDKTAPNYASQQTIFNDLGSEILDSSFDGYNVCLFAYGQTGSGKTYTMMGDEADQGVIPRLCESLLGRISSYEEDVTFKVEVSFLEIYNERVRDLLAPPNKAKYSLKVREHPKDGPYVQDLSHHLVSDYEQVLSLMHDGNLQRTTAATHMHELSSRSHAIFTITFIQAKMTQGIPSEIVSKINLVDLAGSERASINSSKDRLQEGANINKSLVTLGNCIQALGEEMLESAADSALIAASMESLSMSEDWDAPSGPRRRTNYVPYRNSILTWLLKDSLGGNSKTIMIATISPASIHYNETMSTLRYARRAKHIVNQPIINEDRNVRLIRELRAEIDRLRMLLNSASLASSQASLIQDQNICRMLQENEQRVDQLTEAWVEKWSNAARIMQECNVGIRKESVGVIVESELPHLIGMDDDLLSTGIILYHLKEGRTKIGRENPDNHQDIVLYGPEVEDEHAVIINTDGHVVLTPLRNSKCAVNGINIHRPIELTQGAVILLGSTNMFRFNHPAEAVKLRERRASKIPGRGLRRALSAEFGKRISLSMSLDGSWSAEPESNLKKTPMRSSFSDLSSDISPIMMFNPGLELERRHKLEAEKLADTKKQLAELEARRAEAEAAQQEQESMMQRSLREHQERIREQKELIERLKKEHQEAMAQAQEELALMKGKINSQKEIGKQKLEGELTQLKEVPSYHSDLCTIPSVVSNACTDAGDLSGLDIARKRVALMELLQKQSQRKALAALERRQATLEVQERTAQLILKHEEQKLQDFETDPRLLEGEFGPEQSPEKELGERDIENTVDSSTENVSTELPASGRVSPVGNSDPETVHNNNLHSPRREAKCIQKLENKGQIIDQKKDQSNSKKSSRKTDCRPARKVELGTPKPKSREEQIKRESNGRSASPARSSSSSKSSRSSSPSKSSRSNSPAKSLRSDSPSKSLRSDSPTKSLRSDSPTKSSRSSSPASTTSRRSRQTSGDVFSRLYPQQETKFDYLRKKSPPRYGEYDPHKERHRDSPHLIRRELSPLSHDPIKLKDRNRENVQDHKHGRTSSVPSSNLPERTKQNLHSRSRSASPCMNKPVKPVTRPKKSPVLPSSQETEKAGRRAKAKSKDIASVPHVRSQSNPVKEKENNKCQTKTKRAQQTTPKESTTSSPTKRKANHPENTLNAKTPKSSPVSPSRLRPVSSKALDRNPSPRKKSEQTPSHRKTVKRPLSSSRNGKDGENASSPSPRRKFARTPVVKPKNWPSMENLPKSTPKSEAFYVPLTSEQLRLELQKHASEQDSGPHLEGADLGASGCEQHWSPSRKRSVGKRPEQTQTDPIQDGIGEEISDFKIGGGNDSDNEENFSSSSESFIDSLEEDLECDQNKRAEVDLEHDSGPRVVDMTSADEDEFWAIPVSSEDILTASSDEGEDDDEDDIALNLDVHGDRKQSSDTLESVNSNDELEADDPCHSALVPVENPEADVNEEQGSAYPETDTSDRRLENDERRSSGDCLGSDQFPPDQIVSYHEETEPSKDNSCNMKHVDNEQVHVPLEMQRQEEITEGANTGDIPDLDGNQDGPSETEIEAYKRYNNNSVSEIDLSGTKEESPTVGIHDGTDQSPQGPCHNENQSRTEYEVSPEPPSADVTREQEIVGPTAKEADACKTDEEDNVSGELVKTGHEIPQFDNSDTSDSLPQGPHTDETYSMPDLPSEDLSSELILHNVKIDKETNEPSDEQESCQVPERNEQKTTEQGPPIDPDEMIDQEPQHKLYSDGVLSLEDLPNECPVAAPSHHDAVSESELDRPTQEMEIMKDDIIENIENPEESRLKFGEENPPAADSYSTDQLPQESHTNEILSSTDLLEGDSISSSPLHPGISYEEETCGPRGEREALENDRFDNDPARLKMAEEVLQIGMSDVNDPVLQEALFKTPSATDLCNEHPSCSDAVQCIVSFEKGVEEPTENVEVGTEDESGKFPERNDHRSIEEEPKVNINARNDIPEEQSDNEIHPMSGLPSGDSTSSVSSHPDFTCDSAMEGSLIEGDTTLCKEDGEHVPPRSEFETSEEDIHIENSDACDQLHEGEPHIDGNHTMPDLRGEERPLEQFHLDVKDAACDKPTGNHDISFISKPDNALDPKTEREVPSSEENIDHHLEMSSFEASQESHPGISTPEEFISKDLEPSFMRDDDIETSVEAEEGEPSGDGSEIAIPTNSPEDHHKSKKEVEMNGNAHGDNPHQSECEGVGAEPSADGNTVSTDKETANNEAALVFSQCPAEESSLDITDQAPNDLVRLNENICVSGNDDENISQKDASDDQEAATTADSTSSPAGCSNNAPLQGHRNEQDADSVFADSAMLDQSTALKISCVKNCPISAEKQDQNEAKDEEQLPEEAMPLIAVQSEADEIPAVSCTVMANQLNQLQRPVIVNLSTVEQDSSDYDEGSSDLVSYDQSQSSEEEMQSPQESLPDEESQPPEKSVAKNKEQQKPVGNGKNTKEVLSEQDPVTSDETTGDMVKVRKSEELQPETTNIPKMNIFSNTKSDEYPANQQFQKPHGNERKAYPSSHNFRITRASPVPFSDEEMESMESPSSCSSPSAAEYHFDEEQTLSDFLEDVNEVDEEEAAMSDDVSALQNSEANDEKTDGSHDSGTDNTTSESEIRLGIPEALKKGKVPSIQSSLPPIVYKSLFNSDSPLKQNILANSTGDGTLPDESALYQSAVDTSLYQTAVESPSAFSNKNEIDPIKKTWQKDQILAYSTPTGTPEGTPARKMSENPEKQKFCPSLIEQLGGSPSVHKCRVLPQLDVSQSPSMARKIPVSPTDLQGNVVSDDASAISENIPIVDNSVCMGDICTDRKSGSTFCTEVNGRKDDNEKGEETKGLYRSPHDLPEQSYILHTLETIQEEDSQAEVSESEDTCSTLHSNSPQNSRETSPDVEHMSVSSPEDVNHDSTQDASLTEEIACITKVPVDEDINKEQPSGISQRADQEVISEGNEGPQSIGNNLEPSADQSHAHLIKSQLRENELPLPENSMIIKQETIPTNVDGAVEQDDVSEAAFSNQPRARPVKKMTPDDNEEVLSTMLPSSHTKTDNIHSPEVLMGMHESADDDVENTEEIPNTVLDSTKKEPSVELPEVDPTSKNNDVFSRLYPQNVPKFDFKRKSGASVIPKGRSFGNVSPKIKRKDLKAKKADMFEDKFDGGIHNKKLDAEGIDGEDDVGGESLSASTGLLNTCDKSNEADNQQHDILRKTEVCEGEPAVAPDGDCIPETIPESEPEIHADNSLKDPISDVLSGTGAKNEMDFHEDDTKNKPPSLSPHKYSDAHESQAVENLKPFLGKDYAVASAKLTMFMRMFGLSVESTDSSESSDSLRMHRDRGLVDRIVGDGVGYDPDTLTNSLSGSPGSIGHKDGETVPDGDESADQTWTGSDVAVDGDSSIRELRSRSTTASDAELMSGGDDAMTNSTSAMSLHNMEEDQKLETVSKYPTTLPRMQPESCITRSMQLAYPTEDIAHTLNKLDIGVPRSIKSSMEEDANIDKLSASSFPQIGEQNNLTPDIHEIPEIDFSDETKAMESCKERDHNHNVDSLEELKKDLDEPASPYNIDDSMLTSPSSVANQEDHVQIQELVMTPSKLSAVKHPDVSSIEEMCEQSRTADEPNPSADEDEGRDDATLSAEAEGPLIVEAKMQENVPHLIPRVTEVIHASMVQLEENEISSIQGIKDLFAGSDETPNNKKSDLDEESGPSTEVNATKEGETEPPLRYVEVNDSSVNFKIERDDWKPMQRQVSEKVTVDRVQLAEISLPSLFEKMEESDSSHEVTEKESSGSEPQQNDNFSVHSQSKVKLPVYEEDEAVAGQDLVKPQIREICEKEPTYLPEHSLPAILSKLDASEGPLSHQRSLSESKSEDTHGPEQEDESQSSAPKEQERQKTLGENNSQPEPDKPVPDISNQHSNNLDHDHNRLEQPIGKGNEVISTKQLPKIQVNETWTKHPIHLPEHSMPAMLSKLGESADPLSHQSSSEGSKTQDLFKREEKDREDGDSKPSAIEGEAQQRGNHLEPKAEAVVFDGNPQSRNANDADDHEKIPTVMINPKKDQGVNTDDVFVDHVKGKIPADKNAIPVAQILPSAGDISAKDQSSHHVTTQEISDASCGSVDELTQPTCNSDISKEPKTQQLMPFRKTAQEEPILVEVAYPSSDEPVKWHLLSIDSSKGSTCSQSSRDSAGMVNPAVDKSTQCQPAEVAKGLSKDNLDLLVSPEREDKSTSPAHLAESLHSFRPTDLLVPCEREDKSTSPTELADSLHSFKPITPSPRLIIAAGHMDTTLPHVKELGRDSTVDTPDIDSKEHEHPSKPKKSSEWISLKAILHKETQSDFQETTSSLQVPPLQTVGGLSPAYSPLLSSRSTDDELAQIFAAAKQKALIKHTFTNTSPEIQVAQRSIADASTTTDDSLDNISNGPVQDLEEIPSTASAQTSPIEVLIEQRSVLDASTATDDTPKPSSNDPVQDIDGITSAAYTETSQFEEPTTTASVQTSPFEELGNSKDYEVSYQNTATETMALTPPYGPKSLADTDGAGIGDSAKQLTRDEEYMSGSRSISTSLIVQPDFNLSGPGAENLSQLKIKTSTPNIASVSEQEIQANLNSQSNSQECQTDPFPSGPSSPSSTEDDASGPWRKASEVLDELSGNMDAEELELFAVLMHKRRLSEQTVDRVKGLVAKLRKHNQSHVPTLLTADLRFDGGLSPNPSSATNAEEGISSLPGVNPDVLGGEIKCSPPARHHGEETEEYSDQNIAVLMLSPLPLFETGTREFDFGDIRQDTPATERSNQPLTNYEQEISMPKGNLQSSPLVDDEFMTVPGQNGSISPPLVSALEQSKSPRSGLPFDRKPTPPTKTQQEKPISDRPAAYSKVPVSHIMGTSSHNDWHSMPLPSTWDESLNRNNNSSTDYSEDDIGNGEVAGDILSEDSLKQDSVGSKHSQKVTLSTFSDVSFDSELDFPVDTNDKKEGFDVVKRGEEKNQSTPCIHASTQSLDSDLFADSAEPELLALQGDTDDSNALTGSLPVDFSPSTAFVGEETQGVVKDDQGEAEDKLNEAESFRINMPPISPANLEWLLAESETEPDDRYLPLSKHPEKDKIPLPGFKHQSTEGPFVIEKQPNEELMQKLEGKIHPQHAGMEAYPVKFAMDIEQKGTFPPSSHVGPSARSRQVPGYANQVPLSSNQYPGVALPLAGNRQGNLERTGSSLGESSGIYSLASEIPHQQQVKTPSESMDSLINAASTDEEKDMQQLQTEYERLLQERNSSGLRPGDTPGPIDVQQGKSSKGSDDSNKISQPHSNGIMSGYSSGDSASSSEVDGFVYGHYSQSMDRRDISIELLEAQVMHGIGETDALLKFLDDDLPLEYWKNRKSQPKSREGEVEHRKPPADKREITHKPNTGSDSSSVYQFKRSPSASLRKSPSGPQSSRSSPSSVTPPPPQRVVTPLLRTSPREQSPSPRGRFKPSEHLKFLRRVRENVVKATANPTTSPTPSSPSPKPQLYSLYSTEAPTENLRTSSFNMEKNDMELFLNELREARKMSQSEIEMAEKELHPSRRKYSTGEDNVFANDTHHLGGGDSRNLPAERDGDHSLKQRTQRSDEELIDREIASMRAAAAVIHPSTASTSLGTSPSKEDKPSIEETEGSPSKPYFYEMYDLPSRINPPCKSISQSRPQSQFGYSLYKDPLRSQAAFTKTYPPSTSTLQGDEPLRTATPLPQTGSIQLQKYTPLKSTGSSHSLPVPPNRRSTPQPSGVYLSVPQHRGVASPQGGESTRTYRGSPGSQVKISPVKSSLRNRRQHAGKPFQELPTVRESKLAWSRPECHLVAETALQTLVSEMAPLECFDPNKSQQPDEEGGWRYEGREQDILLLCKTHSPTSPINSYAGIGIIKAPARTVFNYVKNPTSRQLYDPMLKEVKIKKDFEGDLQVVYMVFKTDQCLLQHPRDCLCVIKTLEMDDRFLVVAASIKHPRIPPKKKTIRAEVLLAGCSIQPLQTGDMEHCRVTHLSQVHLHGDLQPKLINALCSRLPLCIADLRNIVQIGDV